MYTLDIKKVWEQRPPNLESFFRLTEVNFTEEFITESSVKLIGIGGMPISNINSDMVNSTYYMMGASSAMSYLNPSSKDLHDLATLVIDKGHTSISHTVSANILISGVTLGCEAEFNTQRDLIHTSRITIARAKCQSDPVYVALNKDIIPKLRNLTESLKLDDHNGSRDSLEINNLLAPACKGTAFILSGTLRNFQKLISAEDDLGKEMEYKDNLKKIKAVLNNFWPDLF